MILALVLGCSEPVCTLKIDAGDRSCEVDEDCSLVYTDCAQACSCAAVSTSSAADYEGRRAADCGAGCELAPCDQDCKAATDVICRRNVCETVDLAGDTFEY
ncbi:MAG TPA: hypothetical protein QGF58_20705 [Myxococcota bacterium]|nr:hypothetical protein [Myxococcota bacterium]